MPRPRTGSAVWRKGHWYARISLTRQPKGADGRHPRIESLIQHKGEPLTVDNRATKALARRLAQHAQTRYDAGTWTPDAEKRLVAKATVAPSEPVLAVRTVASWCAEWLATQTYSEAAKDLRRTKSALKIVHPETGWCFGAIALAAVKPTDVAAWLALVRARPTARKGTPPAPRTVRNTLDPVARALKGAVFAGHLAQDPTAVLPTDIRPQAVDADPTKRRAYRLSRLEVEAIFTSGALEPRWQVLWHLLLLTGMRVSEAIGLRWGDFLADEPLGRILVVRQVHHRTRTIEPLKTRNYRELPEHPLLRARLDWWAGEGWPEEYGRAPTAGDLVVPCRGSAGRPRGAAEGVGGPLWQQDVHRALQRGLELVGLPSHRVHDFRHTFASLCADAGMAENVAERWTHSPTVDTTSRQLYALPSWERQCAEMAKLVLRVPPAVTTSARRFG